MSLYVEDQKLEKEPQGFDPFKTAVMEADAKSAFVASENWEVRGHTLYVGASHSCSARYLAHCIAHFFFVGGSIQGMEQHPPPGILLRDGRGKWYKEPPG